MKGVALTGTLIALAIVTLAAAPGTASAAVTDSARTAPSTGHDEPRSGGWLTPTAEDGSIYISGARTTLTDASRTDPDSTPKYGYLRRPRAFCGTLDAVATTAPCVEGAPSGRVIRYCADGSEALEPLFRREVDPVTAQYIGTWEQVEAGGCPEDAPAGPVVVSVEEFRRLPLTASTPQFQPADGRGLVNMDLIVFTDPGEQTLTTTVLGVPVTVRATPVQYSWDFGDGSDPLVTTDPGAPYPHYTVGHPYRQPGTYPVQLVTTWSGQFQVNGTGPWLPVDGTATTTSPPFTAEVFEAHAHLVAGPDHP